MMRVIFLVMTSICFSPASDIFTDSKTGLMWQDNREAAYLQKDWQGAVAFCEHLQLAGYDDWRLPKIKELIQILSTDPRDGGMKKGFRNVGASGYYWSSSPNESSDDFAWMMNFKRGYEYSNYKSYERHVRCVRDNR